MLVDRAASRIVSHLGWVDGNRLWVYDRSAEEPHYLPIEAGPYSIKLIAGQADYFTIVHFSHDERAHLCVHHLAEPQAPRAELLVDDRVARFSGDATLWRFVPGAYRVWEGLLRVDRERQSIDVDPLRWSEAMYRQGDQLLTGLIEVPGTDLVLFSVRYAPDYSLILYDTRSRQILRTLALSERPGGGDSLLRLRRGTELWATDAGTLVRLDLKDWRVRDSVDLDPWRGNRSGRIGDYSFSSDESRCVAPRTLRGNAVVLDSDHFRVTHTAQLGGRPLETAMLDDEWVIARDWSSGDLLRGRLRPV